MQGNFNKMAFIKKLLAITPRADAEWIWWTDADTLITDTPFEFPFHRCGPSLSALVGFQLFDATSCRLQTADGRTICCKNLQHLVCAR